MKLQVILPVLIFALVAASPTSADQRLSDLLLQIQRLQQEVQQLRGQVELQQHEISTLKRQQQEQYMDLDARLQRRSGATAPPATGGGAGQAIGMETIQSQRPGRQGAMTPQAASGVDAAGPKGGEEAYRVAFDLLKQRKFNDAVRAFEDLLVRYPNGEYADNARYWLGETNYVQQDYAAALTQFQRVLANYPLSPKVPSSMLKIGYIHYEQNDWPRARATLRDVATKFADTTEARLAESRLDRMTREGH